MQFDFDKQRSLTDYVTIPAGTYLCRVEEVRAGTTRAGDERWSMKLVVAEGQHVGKQAAWDSRVFSARGHARADARACDLQASPALVLAVETQAKLVLMMTVTDDGG